MFICTLIVKLDDKSLYSIILKIVVQLLCSRNEQFFIVLTVICLPTLENLLGVLKNWRNKLQWAFNFPSIKCYQTLELVSIPDEVFSTKWKILL